MCAYRRCRGASRSPGLRLFAEPSGDTVVGARQLSNVRWSAVFDDVELTADEVTRLAAEARPLVQSHGRWVELDRVDLKEAAAALAERASTTQLTGAEILRHAVGLEGSPLGRAPTRRRRRLGDRPARQGRVRVPTEPVDAPDGFVGELRTLPGRSTRLARLPRRGRARRLPRARHGPRQDADGARPPRQHDRRRPGARHRPARRRRQLGRRGRAVHAGLRVVVHHGAIAGVGRRARGRGAPAPTSSSRRTAPRSATSTRSRS